MTDIATPLDSAVQRDFIARIHELIDDSPELLDPSRWEAPDLPARELIAALGARGILRDCTTLSGTDRAVALERAALLHAQIAAEGNGAAGATVLAHLDVSIRLLESVPGSCTDLLAAMVEGSRVACLAVSEPDSGSDLTRLETLVHQVDGRLVVSGAKHSISNAPYADDHLVLVGDPDHLLGDRPGHALVRVGSGDGVSVTTLNTSGHPGLTGTIELAATPVVEVVVPPQQAMITLMRHWIHERVMVAVRMAALARSVLEKAARDASGVTTFGRALIENQHVQFTLAELLIAVSELEAMSQQGIRLLGEGACPPSYAAACKFMASQVLRRVADASLQFAGGAGYQTGHYAERAWRDVAGLALAGGSEELMLIQIERGIR